MLCKKCKTAISDNDRMCSYCGAKQRNKRLGMYILTGILLVLLSGSIVYVIMDIRTSNKIAELEKESKKETFTPTISIDVEPAPAIAAELPKTETEQNEDQPEEHSETDIKRILEEMASNAVRYYNSYSYYVQFITKHGYLYDEASADYVTLDDFTRTGLTSEIYEEGQIYIMYVKPEDIGFKDNGGTLKIYAVYDDADSFMVADEDGQIANISREEFGAIIESYNCVHGPIVRPNETDYQYKSIKEAISSYEFSTEGYDVRYLSYDSKYGVAVVSYNSAPDVIYEYVMEKYNDQWVVRVANVETFDRFRKKVNELVSDMNMDLLPKFDLQRFVGKHETDFSHINSTMKASGYLAENETVIFQAGTNEFVYQEFSTGRKIVFASSSGEGWRVLEVKSWQEAEAQMAELSSNPPLFLIRQR